MSPQANASSDEPVDSSPPGSSGSSHTLSPPRSDHLPSAGTAVTAVAGDEMNSSEAGRGESKQRKSSARSSGKSSRKSASESSVKAGAASTGTSGSNPAVEFKTQSADCDR